MIRDKHDSPITVSVIIPTYNRVESLRNTLNSLAAQTFPVEQFEVVVVDDGSTDATPTVIQDAFPFALHYYRQSNQGAAVARNLGGQRSQGDVLIFLDDDITLEPDFIRGIAQEHRACDKVIVRGIVLHDANSNASLFRTLYVPLTVGLHSEDSDVYFADLASNNFAIKRDHFFALGMWHDIAGDGRTVWGDVDLAYRAYKQGFSFRQSLIAHCYHRDYAIRDLGTYCRRCESSARLAVLLFQKHPDLEPLIPMFRDKGYIDWRKDSLGLVVRKLLRLVVSWGPVSRLLEGITHWLEQIFPKPYLLIPLYRWIVGSYIFRGYRQGLYDCRKDGAL